MKYKATTKNKSASYFPSLPEIRTDMTILISSMRIAIFSIFALLFLTPVQAQTYSTFTHYGTDVGFVQKEVMKIAQDAKGKIWLATWDGLYSYDGHRFDNYKARPGDGIMMQSNRLSTICMDGNNVWIQGYNGSVSCFNAAIAAIRDLPLSKYISGKLYPTDNGGILITMHDRRLVKAFVDDKTFKIKIMPVNGINGALVNDIERGTNGGIYVLTDRGVFLYKERSGAPYINKVYNEGDFLSMCSVKNTQMFGTAQGVLLLVRNGRKTVRKLPKRTSITSLTPMKDGRVMAATSSDGVYILDAEGIVQYHLTTENSILNTNQIGKLRTDSRGNVWFCTGVPGVMRFDISDNTLHHLKMNGEFSSDASLWMREVIIAEDMKGNLWLSPSGNGLARYDGATDTLVPFFDETRQKAWTTENTVVDIFVDKQDNLWFCGKYTGLEKVTFNTRRFNTIDMKCDTEIGNDVRGLFQDRDGFIWVGAKNGVISIFDKSMQHVGNLTPSGHVSPFGRDNIGRAYCFAQDKTGNIWIGTKFNGLYRLRPKGQLTFDIRHYKADQTPDGLIHDDIFSLCIDRHNRLWIATYGGGICYLPLDGDQNKFVSTRNGLTAYPKETCYKSRCITTDGHGTIWVGTTSGLLSFAEDFTDPRRIRFNRFTRRPDDATSLSNNDVLQVFFTRRDEMYVCTYGGGFCRVWRNGNSLVFRPFTTGNGLRSDVIFSVQQDQDDNLWFAGENGLVKYNPKEDKTETYSSRFFGKHIEINEGTAIRLADGRLMFPCRNHGVMYFDPRRVKSSSYVPHIILTRLFIGQKEVLPSDGDGLLTTNIDNTELLTLPHDKNSFRIDFAALDYRDPDNIGYSYKLEGLDKSWTAAGNTHSAIFNNVPPGKYRLLIRSTNSDGVWTDNIRSIGITVEPSFWQTGKAVLLYIFLIICIIAISTFILFTIFRLKQKVKMEERLSDLKLRFFTNISHEIRTPLTLISGSVKEILRNGEVDGETKETLTVVDYNSDRLTRLVNQILDIRKMEGGGLRLRLRLTDIGHFVNATADNFRNMARERNVTLTITQPDTPVMIWVDNDALDKIVFNLLSNAFRFTPTGKTISVDVCTDGNKARISVKDEGPGISPDRKDKIFKLFESTMGEGIMKQSGTGIGLTLTKELVEMHHGSITVESVPGKGSTFIVELPVGRNEAESDNDYIIDEPETDRKATAMTAEDSGDTAGSTPEGDIEDNNLRQTVLVVEDNTDMRKFIRKILCREYNVAEAANGEEGIRLANRLMPDMIITDYMMPVTDGMEMARRLRCNMGTSHIPIIILSAKTDNESKMCGLETGIDDYIEKPFSTDLLRARIKNLMARQERIRAYFRGKYVDNEERTMAGTSSADSLFMSRLTAVIDKNISNGDLNVDDVASELNMSRSVYFKKLKTLTGMSPNEFLKAVRMQRAAELIDSHRYTMAEVSLMVGINDPHYFSKCFKQHFDMTPTERRNMKKEG